MELKFHADTPFEMQLSFSAVLEHWEKVAANSPEENAYAVNLLRQAAAFPELRNGITTAAQLQQHAGLLRQLLAPFFPEGLTLNEIKAVSIPYQNVIFNHTERFANILKAAGPEFSIGFADFSEHQFYVSSCCLVLNEFYGTQLDFGKPLFYEIPNEENIVKYYRILYNADFLEIAPTSKAVPISPEEIEQLLNNYDDLDLWKRKFPKGSWCLKGFALMTLFDATVENAVSILKERLLGMNAIGFKDTVQSIFRSIYRIPDLRVGFTTFNPDNEQLIPDAFGQQLPSYMLTQQQPEKACNLLCNNSYSHLITKRTYFAVSDTLQWEVDTPGNLMARHFLEQDIRSFIIAPIVKNEKLFGFLEVVSPRARELNSINANKLDIITSFVTDTIERMSAELENQVQAVIQEEYTTIHNSVNWKFRQEAQKYIFARQVNETYELQEVIFRDIHPLYGQVDIKGSSDARNNSVQADLLLQLETLSLLLKELNKQIAGSPFQTDLDQLKTYRLAATLPLKAGTDQYINHYLDTELHPRLQQINLPELLPAIDSYFVNTSKDTGLFHLNRRKYETTISTINSKLAAVIDHQQQQAQAQFPHYYERFKTDGVEHNLYIGFSIAPGRNFTNSDLQALQLWQLRTLCDMETAHYCLQSSLPYPLEVTTLVLVYHGTIDIRFRMDEKRFDVDGTYNARYEIVKKRIDKAFIKGTQERITQPGLLSIVYSSEAEEQEYMNYIRLLQIEKRLQNNIEKQEVEDLQGISGLKVIRVAFMRTITPDDHLLANGCTP
ncbi:GAF domain-containing protein [Filimonas effusa]|uniref:GAF domain-containing protein n=1 Tax=Filimonas effusa TaxID=2508721 RepID=A0A4Q1D9K2_9BACT|nr:GAF domain-containing protein [Filimonas effusa]RXK86064.1 GAF domain-containing protein [Filimonas effusa]